MRAASAGQIFLIRHGTTAWSAAGRHTSRTDLPLLPEGMAQASSAGALLGGRSFALVLCSPMQRAIATADLAGYGDVIKVTEDLREWDYGDLEGKTSSEICGTYPGWTIWTGPVPNGETLAEVGKRADRVLGRVSRAGGDAALFGHGHMLRVLTARYLDLDPVEGRRFALDTATLNILGREHDYTTVRVWNQSAHGVR